LSPGITDGARRYTAACEKIKESERKKKRRKPFRGVGNEAAKAKGPLATRKIRLHPTTAQTAVLRQFSGAHRWTYNQCVASQREQKKTLSRKALRAMHINKDVAPAWTEDIPYDIRDDGMRDFKKALANCEQAKKKSDIKFRSLRHNATAAFAVRHREMEIGSKCARFYPSFFAKLGVPESDAWIETAEDLPVPASDCKIQWQRRTGHWFICVPMVLKPRTHREERGESQAPPSRRVVALDPGVRAFQTLYDPQEAAVEQWGEGDQGRIIRLCEHLDALMSRIGRAAAQRGGSRWEAEKRRKHVRRLRRAAGRLRQRIRNLVDDLHHQLAAYLVDNYALILLPTFFTSEMVPRRGRVIRSKTARSMLTWGHYRFCCTRRAQCPTARWYWSARPIRASAAATVGTSTAGWVATRRSTAQNAALLSRATPTGRAASSCGSCRESIIKSCPRRRAALLSRTWVSDRGLR
jgi:putative transposase